MELGLGAGVEDSGSPPGMMKVSVAVRVRPLIEREKSAEAQIHWQVGSQELTPYDPVSRRIAPHAQTYTYDHVFNQSTQTQQVYDTMVSPIVKKAFKGFNGTILCYGQTSSGKTHTLYGSNDDKGIILLFADHLYQHIKADESHRQYIIKVGLLEIYNEKVSDLLNSYNPIELIEQDGSIVPHGLEELTVFDINDWKKVTERVQRERKIGETRMNKESSRSHTILRVTIESFDLTTNTAFDDVEENPENSPPLTTAVLHFVDLAGSEKQSQTGAEGERFKEQVNINMSLSVLSRVIKQLSEQASVSESHQVKSSTTEPSLAKAMCQSLIRNPPKSRFINFRDSKLTRLLQSSLNGEAFISMVCNVTIASLEETKSTLQFAKQAKKIQIRPKQNLCSSKSELESKLQELQEQVNLKDKEVMVLRKQCENMKRAFEFRDEQTTQRAPNIDRRLSLCPTMFRSSAGKSRHSNPEPMSTFSYYKNKYSSSGKMDSLGLEDGFISGAEFRKTVLSPLKPIRESKCSDVIRFDKEVQTESCDEEGSRLVQLLTIRESPDEDFSLGPQVKPEQKVPPVTPERKSLQKRDLGTPAPMLRLNNALLRTTNEEDRLEYEEMKTYLESEIATLREDVASIPKLKSEIETLQFEKKELENDVMRQMQASRVEMTRRMAESPEVLALKSKLQAAEESVVNKDKEIETITAELHSVITHQDKGDEVEQQLKELQSTVDKLTSANEDLEMKHKNQLEICEEQIRQLEEQRSLILSVTKQAEEHEHCQNLASKLKLSEDQVEKLVAKEASLHEQLKTQQDALEKAESRVHAEVSELQNRLQVTEKQVLEKVKLIDTVTAEFQTLQEHQEKELGPKLKELQSAIVKLMSTNEDLEEKLKTQTEFSEGQTQQIEGQQSMITSLSKLAKEHENCLELVSKLKLAEDQVDKLVANVASLHEQLKTQQDALEKAESRVHAEVSELENRLQEAEEQLLEKGKLIETVTAEFQAKQVKYNELQPKLKELQSAIVKLMSTNEDLEEKLKTQTEVTEEQTQQIEEQRSMITSLSKLAKEHENCLELVSKLKLAEDQVDKLVANEATLQQQLNVQEVEYQKAESALQEMKLELLKVEDTKITDLKNKIEAAEEQAAQKDELIQNITAELQSAKAQLENFEDLESQLLDLETINMKLLSTNEDLELKLENQEKVSEEQQCMITAMFKEVEEHKNCQDLTIKLKAAEDQLETLLAAKIDFDAKLHASQNEYENAERLTEQLRNELSAMAEKMETVRTNADEQLQKLNVIAQEHEHCQDLHENLKIARNEVEKLVAGKLAVDEQVKNLQIVQERADITISKMREELTLIKEESEIERRNAESQIEKLKQIVQEHEHCQELHENLKIARDQVEKLTADKLTMDEQVKNLQDAQEGAEMTISKMKEELTLIKGESEIERRNAESQIEKLKQIVIEHEKCQEVDKCLKIALDEVEKLAADKLTMDEQVKNLQDAQEGAEMTISKMKEELTLIKGESEIERRNAESQIEKLKQIVIEHEKCQEVDKCLKIALDEVEKLAADKLTMDEQVKNLQDAQERAEMTISKMKEELTLIKGESEIERRNAESQIEKLKQIVIEHGKCREVIENLETVRGQVEQLMVEKTTLQAEVKAQQIGFDNAEQKYTAKVMSLMNQIQAAEEQVADKNTIIATMTTELESVKAQHQRQEHLESQLNELQSTNVNLSSAIEDLERELKNQRETCAKQTRYIEDQLALIKSMNKIADEHEHCRDLGGRLKFAEEQVANLTKSKEVLQQQHLESQQGTFARVKLAEDQVVKLLANNVALQHQLKTYQDMAAKLNTAQDQVERLMAEKVVLEQELKALQDVCEKDGKGGRGVVVTRATQCSDLSTQMDHFRDASKHYRTRAHNAEFELERTKKVLEEIESEYHMLMKQGAPQEPATNRVQSKVNDGEAVTMVNCGLQCTLLNELLQRPKGNEGETRLVGLPGVAQLQSDLKSAEAARDKLKYELSKCNCGRKQLCSQGPEKPAGTVTTKFNVPTGFQRKVAFFQGGSTLMNRKESAVQPSRPQIMPKPTIEDKQESKSTPASSNDPENIENTPEKVTSAPAESPDEEQPEDDGYNWLLQLVQKKT